MTDIECFHWRLPLVVVIVSCYFELPVGVAI